MELLEKNKGRIIKNLEISQEDSEAIFSQAVKNKRQPLAKIILAHFYIHGIHPVSGNLHMAKKYLRQAGHDGSHEAFRYLGILYDYLNDEKYEYYLMEASRMGNKEANLELIDILMKRKRWKRALDRIDVDKEELIVKKAVCLYQVNEQAKAFELWREWTLNNVNQNPIDIVTKYIPDNGFIFQYFSLLCELRAEMTPLWKKMTIGIKEKLQRRNT